MDIPRRALLVLALAVVPASLACGPREVQAMDPLERDLFDGQTLAGWVTTGGRYDGDAEWTVEGGAITGRTKDGRGGLLYTERAYTEFVLTLEARTDWPFDSGIFLRMAPRGKGAQITLDTRPGGEVGAIYSDGFLRHNPDGEKLWKRDGWNAIEVRCTGEPMRIAVQLNGAALVDYEVPRELQGFAPTGRIGLQVHGDRDDPPGNAARFRKLRIRELSETPQELIRRDEAGFARLTPWGVAHGWTDLLAGGSLAAWEEAQGAGGWKLEAGVLAALVQGGSGLLRTKADHRDFELRLDFKIAELANSGVFLRGDRAGGDPAWTGMELQILDDFHWEERTRTKLQPWQFTGSLYGSVAPARPALRPIGAWNELEVRVEGQRVATRLNGVLLYDVDTREVPVPEGKRPLAERAGTGFIGLQRHAPDGVAGEAYAWFRNILVRDL
ncbi:MAG: DUF1080 domain-containing protein [Planctomycetes bacterium]|nr:DUF1080 domain-containing protein [Planctomycetota bacterium]